MRLEMRLEQHDSRCRVCLEPRSSDRPCVPCALEDAELASAGEGSVQQAMDRIEAARTERRRANEEGEKNDE